MLKKMHIYRAILRAQQLQEEVLPVGTTVTVLSCLPTATINSIFSLRATTLAASATGVMESEIIPTSPVLEDVQLTVGVMTNKAAGNKKILVSGRALL